MTPEFFKAWRKSHGSRRKVGEMLGRSPSMLVQYEAGKEIPKVVRLAMAAVQFGLSDYPVTEMTGDDAEQADDMGTSAPHPGAETDAVVAEADADSPPAERDAG